MKAYGLDLRKRIVSFVTAGGGKVEAAKRFGVARKTVYNYLALVQAGALAPKESWGTWKKFDPAKGAGVCGQTPGRDAVGDWPGLSRDGCRGLECVAFAGHHAKKNS